MPPRSGRKKELFYTIPDLGHARRADHHFEDTMLEGHPRHREGRGGEGDRGVVPPFAVLRGDMEGGVLLPDPDAVGSHAGKRCGHDSLPADLVDLHHRFVRPGPFTAGQRLHRGPRGREDMAVPVPYQHINPECDGLVLVFVLCAVHHLPDVIAQFTEVFLWYILAHADSSRRVAGLRLSPKYIFLTCRYKFFDLAISKEKRNQSKVSN